MRGGVLLAMFLYINIELVNKQSIEKCLTLSLCKKGQKRLAACVLLATKISLCLLVLFLMNYQVINKWKYIWCNWLCVCPTLTWFSIEFFKAMEFKREVLLFFFLFIFFFFGIVDLPSLKSTYLTRYIILRRYASAIKFLFVSILSLKTEFLCQSCIAKLQPPSVGSVSI